MKYTKPALTIEDQADLLLSRGMQGDRDLMIARLKTTNYYRLSGYWQPFRAPDPNSNTAYLDSFVPGTTFEEVWCRYTFDRHLRLVVMDAIERIEVCVRTQLTYEHSHRYGPFAYATDPLSLPKMTPDAFAEFTVRVQEETDRSKDTFAEHFRAKYGMDHQNRLPAWMMAEVIAFGTTLTFFKGSSKQVKQAVADQFALPEPVLESWLLTLNAVRNICAHHGRLWNRELGVKPYIPRLDLHKEWHTPVKVLPNRLFGVLTLCKWSLDRIAPQSHWPSRLHSLLQRSHRIPLDKMGFPANWLDCPIWASLVPPVQPHSATQQPPIGPTEIGAHA